jgi:hypothetical protein
MLNVVGTTCNCLSCIECVQWWSHLSVVYLWDGDDGVDVDVMIGELVTMVPLNHICLRCNWVLVFFLVLV